MTQLLREELARLADRSGPAHVAPDTWSRGRRARRRDQVVVGVLALALVLVLAGITTLSLGPTRIAPAAPVEGPGRVPSEVHPVPTYVQDGDGVPFESDLAIGPQALAFVTARGTPVVVSATDGTYRLLDLQECTARVLALSPDGTRLACSLPHGARVTDLLTGESQRFGFPPNWFGDLSWHVTSLAWSTDGRELFYGASTTDSDEMVASRKAAVADGTLTPPLLVGTIPAMGPAGLQITVTATTVTTTGPQPQSLNWLDLEDPLAPTGTAYASPDLDVLAVGNSESGGVDLFTGEAPTGYAESSPLPGPPLGWIDDEVLVVRNDDGVALRDTSSPDAADRLVVEVGPGDAAELPEVLSVATDLLAQPTRDLPAPDWPWSTARQVLVAALAVLAALLLTTTIWYRRRSR